MIKESGISTASTEGNKPDKEYAERSDRLAMRIAMAIIDSARFAGTDAGDEKLKRIIKNEIDRSIQKENLIPTALTLDKISERIGKQYMEMKGSEAIRSKMLTLFSEIAAEYMKE